MDTNMMDVDGDIIIDVDPIMEPEATQAQQTVADVDDGQIEEDSDTAMPAAYFESLETFRPLPESLNLQGVSDFGPNEPEDYALEHCPERRPKRIRWVNDNSVNIEYYSPEEAADALLVLTHPDTEGAALLPAQTPRKGQTYSKKPNSALVIRECNTGDQKQRNAAQRSDFYRKNPQARERDQARARDRELERRRLKPQQDYLDYDGEGAEPDKRSHAFDEAMYDDDSTPKETSHGRRSNNRDRGERNRENREVDRYRPRSASPRESRFGRLRGRSASPASDEDGRLGFAEDGSMNTTRRYRGRSRGDDRRRQRSRSRGERDFGKRGASSALETNRWEKDRSAFTDSGPWPKNASNGRLDVRSHRRSDATDETNNKGSLLSRMTKDGKPLLATKPSLASRITRGDTESPASYGRLRADTEPSYGRLRSTDESYGRLKDDDSAPREDSFQEPGVKSRDLASRITWKRDRGATNHENGFNIKGSAPQVGGFSIKGAAGGDFN